MSAGSALRCLVLGGSGSLGAAVCRFLARDGARVNFTWHRNLDQAQALLAELPTTRSWRCDLRDCAQVAQTVRNAAEALGGLDALACTASAPGDSAFRQHMSGTEGRDSLQDIDPQAFDEVMEINARGTFAACQAAAPLLHANGGGNIVLVTALDGIKPVPAPVHVAASQAALRGLTESMAKELGPRNIRVNLLATGLLESGQSRLVGDELKSAYLAHSALRRFGTVEEVAEVVTFMMLENTYVSGQAIILDGGL